MKTYQAKANTALKRDILLDGSYSLVIDGYDFALTDYSNAVKQRVLLALTLLKGEYFINAEMGIPYFSDVYGKKEPELGSVKAIFVKALNNVEGVKKINSLNLKIGDDRKLSVSASIQDEYGNLVEV